MKNLSGIHNTSLMLRIYDSALPVYLNKMEKEGLKRCDGEWRFRVCISLKTGLWRIRESGYGFIARSKCCDSCRDFLKICFYFTGKHAGCEAKVGEWLHNSISG